jgi:hypothetical protein
MFQRNVQPPASGLRSKLTHPLFSIASIQALSDNGYTLTGSLEVPFSPVTEPGFSTHRLL